MQGMSRERRLLRGIRTSADPSPPRNL